MEELIPKGLPKGIDLVAEGREIGETIQIGKIKLAKKYQARVLCNASRSRALNHNP